MAVGRKPEAVSIPAVTAEAVRRHLERNGDALGRPMQKSMFYAEAAMRLIRDDVEYLARMKDSGYVDPALMDDEQAPAWERAPPVKEKRR